VHARARPDAAVQRTAVADEEDSLHRLGDWIGELRRNVPLARDFFTFLFYLSSELAVSISTVAAHPQTRQRVDSSVTIIAPSAFVPSRSISPFFFFNEAKALPFI
jgi:hypothetical protein